MCLAREQSSAAISGFTLTMWDVKICKLAFVLSTNSVLP